jgi:CheY-like chemotaxis protein
MILLVEDNEDDVLLMRHAFKAIAPELRLVVLKDGQRAWDYLQGIGTYADRERHPLPRLILLDLRLPRLHGFEVLKRLRQDPGLSSVIVVIFSSSTQNSDVDFAYHLGANSYVTKPGTSAERQDVVRLLEAYWFGMNRSGSLHPANSKTVAQSE